MHFFLAQAYRESGRLQDAAAEMKIFGALRSKGARTLQSVRRMCCTPKRPPQ